MSKKRPALKPFPFVGAAWKSGDGPVFRIISVGNDMVWQEARPTRGAFPVNLVDWQDWAMTATCVEPASTQEDLNEKIRMLVAFVQCVKNAIPPEAEPFDDDGPVCAECGTHVAVREGHDFDPGDLCDTCAQAFVGKVRDAYRALTGKDGAGFMGLT